MSLSYTLHYTFEENITFSDKTNLKNTTFILQQTEVSRTTLVFL